MKRKVYILMFMAVLLFTGCNLFKGLDKEDLNSPEAFEFKLDDAMANGDYTVIVGLIDEKIAGNVALKAVDDAIGVNFTSIASITSATTTTEIAIILDNLAAYLNTEITKPEVKEYVDLKVTQAEAYLGQSGLKMTDIIASLSSSTSSNKVASLTKSVQNNKTAGKITVGDLSPAGLNREKLSDAVKSYLAGLPTTSGAAFNVLKDEYKLGYLNAALSSAISAINRVIYVYKIEGSNNLVSSSTAITQAYKDKWDDEIGFVKLDLKVALLYLKLYGTASGLLSAEDLNKLDADFDSLLNDKLKAFTTEQEYLDFTSGAGLTVANN